MSNDSLLPLHPPRECPKTRNRPYPAKSPCPVETSFIRPIASPVGSNAKTSRGDAGNQPLALIYSAIGRAKLLLSPNISLPFANRHIPAYSGTPRLERRHVSP
jgi:hypothetical protein